MTVKDYHVAGIDPGAGRTDVATMLVRIGEKGIRAAELVELETFWEMDFGPQIELLHERLVTRRQVSRVHLDASGIGAPVTDVLARRLSANRVKGMPIYAGTRERLIMQLRMAFEQGRLAIPHKVHPARPLDRGSPDLMAIALAWDAARGIAAKRTTPTVAVPEEAEA